MSHLFQSNVFFKEVALLYFITLVQKERLIFGPLHSSPPISADSFYPYSSIFCLLCPPFNTNSFAIIYFNGVHAKLFWYFTVHAVKAFAGNTIIISHLRKENRIKPVVRGILLKFRVLNMYQRGSN